MSETHEVVLTTGNARAMLDRETGEVMHPVVGPRIESRRLYVGPSRLSERLGRASNAPLVLLDVGLGAGSNAVAARRVSEARERPCRRLHIISFDRTAAALELAAQPRNAAAFELEGEMGEAARALIRSGRHETDATLWSLVSGELPGTLRQLAPVVADLVFWDPFSPRANPSLWTAAAFEALRDVCGPQTTVHTYGAATSTRAALLLAGFAVGRGDASGPTKETTVAAVRMRDLDRPLDARWLGRLARSSAPFPTDAPPDAMERIRRHRQFAGDRDAPDVPSGRGPRPARS